ITFKDSDINRIIKSKNQIFKSIAPVISIHTSKTWSPVGGSANSVIHETDHGLFIIDYYLAPESNSKILSDASILHGDNSLKRTTHLILNKEVNNNVKETHTLQKDINLLINLIFISLKGIVRNTDNDFIS